jgi:protein-S-isoprenylcysteine O-methyltransferase Ste14
MTLMAGWALLSLAGYLLLAFGLRSAVQKARTGSTGFKGITGQVGSIEWIGGALFAVALVLGALAPILDLAGIVGPIDALDTEAVHAAGGGLFFGGLISTVLAQAAMGDSWRIGVDHAEQTELVTDGPFAYVRNPVFAGMIPAGLGIALLVPSVVAIFAITLLVAALEIQTRAVEEPYLLRTHGEKYASYARRVGRFFPRVGRVRD